MAFNYTLSTPGTYGFVNQGSYLESNNKGQSNSYALSVLTFTVPAGESYHLYLDCVNYAESNYDYGIVSNINMSLSRSTTGDTDTSLVKQNFKGLSSANTQTLDYGVVTTGGTIDLKFRKDGSVDSNNDSLRVTVRAEAIQVIPSISLSELTGIFYGTNEIGKVYYGANLVYGTTPTPILYDITTTITNGTYSGPTHLYEGQTTATITLSADAGYALPSSITVSGASYTYNSSTGEVVLSNFTGNVTISATCEATVLPYLTFSSLDTFTLNIVNNYRYWDGTLQYSTDTITWNTWDGTTTLSSSSSGTTKYLYLRGKRNKRITGSDATSAVAHFVLTGNNIDCKGNIETLLDYEEVINGQHPSMGGYCYSNLFYGCTSLRTAPTLPAETLTYNCYEYMFQGCTSLTTAPALPVTTLTRYCYHAMFQGCTSLTTAPALPAETLAPYCYKSMFQGCTSLTTAPALPATTLAEECYYSMFHKCTALTTAPALPVETLADSCYSSMFRGCTALTTAPALPATTLAQYCYYYMFYGCTSLTKPAIMAGGAIQAVSAKRCCYYMYYGCTNLNMYTSSSNSRVPCYKAINYGTTSLETIYQSSYRMFYNCKINSSSSTDDYLVATVQYYCDAPTTLITFTVRGTSYSADSGMTWTHFVESAYNLSNHFRIDQAGTVIDGVDHYVAYSDETFVKSTEAIVANYAYRALGSG